MKTKVYSYQIGKNAIVIYNRKREKMMFRRIISKQ